MKKKDTRAIYLMTLKRTVIAPWYWLANMFGIGLIIGYQKAINIFWTNGTFENNMYFLEALSVFTMFVFFVFHVYSISQSVEEEKIKRMNEAIYYRFSPDEFIRAKVIGHMLGAIVQLALFSLALVISKQLMDRNANVLDYKSIILFTGAILLGLMLYMFLFSSLATQTKAEKGILLLAISFLIPLGLLKGHNQSILKDLMFIPFLSPCIAIVCVLSNVTLVTSYTELVFYIFLMVLQVIVVTRICVKGYEKGIKMK